MGPRLVTRLPAFLARWMGQQADVRPTREQLTRSFKRGAGICGGHIASVTSGPKVGPMIYLEGSSLGP